MTPGGVLLPSGGELKAALWAVAAPGAAPDLDSSLGEVFDVAVHRAGNATRKVMEERLTVDASALPEYYGTWFSMPWLRAYTLNVDDLDEAATRAFALPRRIETVSALSGELPAVDVDRLLITHLNGKLAEYPNMTFSPAQYGERVASPEPWYAHLVTDLVTHPIVFVGTTLDEPPLWQHLAARGGRARGSHEFRPGSYLVSPSLPPARRMMLEEFNIQFVEMDGEEFAAEVLQPMEEEARAGFHALGERMRKRHGPAPVQRVSDLAGQPNRANLPDLLLGREPVWADLTQGFAVVRQFEVELQDLIHNRGAGEIVLITGTAGSGKSITIMRLALALQAEGLEVAWIDMRNELSLFETRRLIAEAAPHVVAIDGVDSLGEHTAGFLRELLEAHPELLVLGSSRSTRFVQLRLQEKLREVPFRQFTVPNLEDSDIELLIGALEAARRLGQLQGLTHAEQVEAFREQAGRQLLVAMVQATSGEEFDEKIDRECSELTKETAVAYAVVAIATNMRESVSRDEVLLALGEATNVGLAAAEELVRQHLLLQDEDGDLRTRHRYIADRVVEHFKRDAKLALPMQGLCSLSHRKPSRVPTEEAETSAS